MTCLAAPAASAQADDLPRGVRDYLDQLTGTFTTELSVRQTSPDGQVVEVDAQAASTVAWSDHAPVLVFQGASDEPGLESRSQGTLAYDAVAERFVFTQTELIAGGQVSTALMLGEWDGDATVTWTLQRYELGGEPVAMSAIATWTVLDDGTVAFKAHFETDDGTRTLVNGFDTPAE